MLHYQEIGDGAPLIILHGLFGSGDNWRSIARQLGDQARVFAVDMPNHGNSPHTDDMSYPAMADAVYELIVALDLGSAFVLGHSMGGKAGMALALAHPNAVRGLIVADIAPKSYPQRHHEIIAAMKEVAAATPSSRGEAEEILAKRIPSKSVRAFLLKSLRKRDGGNASQSREADAGYHWALNIDGISECYAGLTSWPDIDGAYDGPSLFIAGGTSDYVDPEDITDIQRLFPHAVLESIDEAGHWLHVEQRRTFTDLVRGFLAEHA